MENAKKASHRAMGRVDLHFYFKKIRKKCKLDYICLEENLEEYKSNMNSGKYIIGNKK